MTGLTDNARQEIAQLTRIAMDVGLDPVERAGALLIAHQRMDTGSCLCGWDVLGKSHAAHQADELAEAGLLAVATAEHPDSTPCREETWSWQHFSTEQVDGYWIRCTLSGRHDEHKDAHTGLTWRGEPDPNCAVHQGRRAKGPKPPPLGEGCICDGSGRTCPRHGAVI